MIEYKASFDTDSAGHYCCGCSHFWLAEQLCKSFEVITDPMVRVLHVHSGDTEHESTLNQHTFTLRNNQRNRIIFHLSFSAQSARVVSK